MLAEVPAAQTTASATYAALGTAGPSNTVPVAGDYDVEVGCYAYATVTAAIYMSYDIGGTGAVDADAVLGISGSGTSAFAGNRVRRKTGLAASTALVSKYRTSAGTATIGDRWMRVMPVRVG